MTFLILLLALAAERYLNLGAMLHRFQWFPSYANLLYKWFGNNSWWKGYQAIALIVAPVLILVGIIYYLPGHWFIGAKFIIGFLVFIYSLGPEDLYHQTQAYFNAVMEGDPEKTSSTMRKILKTSPPEDLQQANRAVLNAILWQANDRLFAVIFWYILLGPIGAVFYRMIVLLDRLTRVSENSFADLGEAVGQLRGISEWVPARLTSFGYAIVGNFTESLGYWLDSVFSGTKFNRALLVETGRTSLKIESKAEVTIEQVRAGLVLVDRTLVAYLIAVAVITFVTWLYIL